MENFAKIIVDSAITVHKILGPGLLESAYEACLEYELKERGIFVERQVQVPVVYKSAKLDCSYRIDLLVEKSIVIELKAVESIAPIHLAQILTYMRLSEKSLGFLLNFNTHLLKDGGIRRVVNGYRG